MMMTGQHPILLSGNRSVAQNYASGDRMDRHLVLLVGCLIEVTSIGGVPVRQEWVHSRDVYPQTT